MAESVDTPMAQLLRKPDWEERTQDSRAHILNGYLLCRLWRGLLSGCHLILSTIANPNLEARMLLKGDRDPAAAESHIFLNKQTFSGKNVFSRKLLVNLHLN